MKNDTMEYNNPGGIDMMSICLCMATVFLKLGTTLLDILPGLAIAATIVAITAGITTVAYNVLRIIKEFIRKRNG